VLLGNASARLAKGHPLRQQPIDILTDHVIPTPLHGEPC